MKPAMRAAEPGDHHNPALDWRSEGHQTRMLRRTAHTLVLEHVRDGARYTVTLTGATAFNMAQTAPHAIDIVRVKGAALELTVSFTRQGDAPAREAGAVFRASDAYWQGYWRSGAAVDFSGSTDARAAELERRAGPPGAGLPYRRQLDGAGGRIQGAAMTGYFQV